MMKLLLLCVMLSLASGSDSKKLALTFTMKEVQSPIMDNVLRKIPEALPNLVISFLPPDLQKYGNYLQQVSVDGAFDSTLRTANVTLYFLSVPQSVAETLLINDVLQGLLSGESVTDTLKGVLPTTLLCGSSCEFLQLELHLVNNDIVPAPFGNPPHHEHTIGLSFFIRGATKAIDPITITTAQDNQCQSLKTENRHDHYILASNIKLDDSKSVVFTVAARNDAHVGFFTDSAMNKNPMYEIVISGWANTKSVIRRSNQGTNQVTKSTPGLLSRTIHKQFWADVKDGVVRVGHGDKVGQEVWMQWTDPNPLDVHAVGVMSGWGSDAEWKVCHAATATTATTRDCRPTTEAACISLAVQHGMPFSDSGSYPTKGCYYYQSGPGSITAQFGTGGTLAQMTQMVYTVGQHRFPCKKAFADTTKPTPAGQGPEQLVSAATAPRINALFVVLGVIAIVL